MKHVAQLLLMCDERDLGLSVNTGDEMGTVPFSAPDHEKGTVPISSPRIFIYDAYPGGIGFSAPLYEMHADLLARTRALISGCECENGCPTCVGPVGQTGPLAKTVALRLLDHLLAGTEVPALPQSVEGQDFSPARIDDEVPF
jgi:DEAD/DEAH box helicase domain-containing protein